MIKKGEFEEWIIPAVVTDFKKSQKADLESNRARVSIMRDSFLAHQDWDTTAGEISRMEKLTKGDIVAVANRYFGDDYVAGYRIDEQHEVPSIEKPGLDTIEIDATRAIRFRPRESWSPVEEDSLSLSMRQTTRSLTITKASSSIILRTRSTISLSSTYFPLMSVVRHNNKLAIAASTARINPHIRKIQQRKT